MHSNKSSQQISCLHAKFVAMYILSYISRLFLQLWNLYVQFGCSVEAVAVMAKLASIQNMNVWFHWWGVVAEWHAAALWNVCHTMEWFMLKLHSLHNGKWVWSAFLPNLPSFVHYFFFFCYVGLLSTATEASKMTATIMKDNYEKLNSSCMRLWKALCSDLCFIVLCNQKCCFLLDLLLYSPPPPTPSSPRRWSITISSCLSMKNENGLSQFWFIWRHDFFFSRIKTKKAEKLNAHCKYGFTNAISHMEMHTIATAARQIWIRSLTLLTSLHDHHDGSLGGAITSGLYTSFRVDSTVRKELVNEWNESLWYELQPQAVRTITGKNKLWEKNHNTCCLDVLGEWASVHMSPHITNGTFTLCSQPSLIERTEC